MESVNEAVVRIVEREDPAYTQLWMSLTRNQKKALKAVIAREGLALHSADTAREFALPPSSMQSALAVLEARHIVRVDAAPGQSRHRLVDPFLPHWLGRAQAL
jgi:hypothetical protein